MFQMILLASKAIGSPILGVVIPGIVFIISVAATYLLYRHFSAKR
jgi:hypothetical protein